jgi:hypothetical protein
MFIIILPCVFVVVFLDLLACQSPPENEIPDWRTALLQTVLFLGAGLALMAEFLSLFNALSLPWLFLSWAVLFIITAWLGWKRGWLTSGWQRLRQNRLTLDRFDRLFLAFIGIILFLLLVIALLSPTNNTDSLQYHMSRVAHWIQNGSLRHYPTGYYPQLTHPFLAELSILNLFLLWGNDQLANLVQWFAMLFTFVGISLLASLLGAGRKGQWAAIAFAASIPMGILQATSTQNDYVAALWLICLGIFVLLAVKRAPSWLEILSMAAALGLGMLTKGTFYPYAVPLGILLFFGWFIRSIRRHPKNTLARAGIILCIVVALNLGYWVRNTMSFGGPLGPKGWVNTMTTESSGITSLVSAASRNFLMNFVTPYDEFNNRMVQGLQKAFQTGDPSLADFYFIWGWNHEDLAGSPLHMLLVLATGLLSLIFWRRFSGTGLLAYLAACLGMYEMLGLLVHPDVYGLRFQLPFFVAWSPIFGAVLARITRGWFVQLAAILLLFAALPWVFFNRSRPLIAMKAEPERLAIPCDWHFGCTMVGSILLEPKTTILFANNMVWREPYTAIAADILSAGCKEVGLRIDSHDSEYLFWKLSKAPQSGIRLENIYPFPELQRYRDPSFKPCAVVCTICGDRQQVHGLDLTADFGEVKLYQGPDYIPEAGP